MSFLRGARRALQKYVADVKKATTPRTFDYREELMLWNFVEEDEWKNWDCISDEDIGGSSTASIKPNGKGKRVNCLQKLYDFFHSSGTGVLFHGCLSTKLPADRSARHAGYCALRSKPKQVATV